MCLLIMINAQGEYGTEFCNYTYCTESQDTVLTTYHARLICQFSLHRLTR